GFGSLILAKHQGIESLGYVMSIGTSTCMIAALTFLPAVLNLLIKWGWTIKKPSGSNALPPPGREEPR
ncbi:MAG: MMPL family transporter, partial [Pedosphaera parvula]|nr:MMPL family transporter [Pedosphaera parvula]